MILPDVNILIYAYDPNANEHAAYRRWLLAAIDGETRFGLSDFVLSAFLRMVTNPRAITRPRSFEDALEFVEALRGRSNRVAVHPGPRHWGIFVRLCREAGATASLVPDAYLAALAIEAGNELITNDRDFARFPGLRWRHPLELRG